MHQDCTGSGGAHQEGHLYLLLYFTHWHNQRDATCRINGSTKRHTMPFCCC